MVVETAESTATAALGAELAASLAPGDVVLLSGDLGSGKTTFVRGAAAALGVERPVTSPTFAIGNRYPVASRPGVRAVAHLDLYRLADLGVEDPDLLADYIGADTVAFVEWPGGAEDRIADFGRIRFRVRLSHLGGDHRRIEVDPA